VRRVRQNVAMIYTFAEFELDDVQYRLMRAGRPVKLEPKVFDVLRYLLQNRDRVLSKRDLLDALWPGEFVTEAALPRAVAAVRRALGDGRAQQRIIRTVHGRGYQFVADVRARAGAETPPAGTPEGESDETFVGREESLRRLCARLEEARAGQGCIVLLYGEPGIGKTRTADELARRARASGCEVYTGRCSESEGAPAFWPWVEILRACLASCDEATLRVELGDRAADIAQLVPELGVRLPELSQAPSLDAEEARFRLFDAVCSCLSQRARTCSMLLVIDDLHWADEPSLLLLRFLAPRLREAKLLVLATYRDVEVRRDHALRDILPGLRREPHGERIHLKGLEREAIAQLVEAAMGRQPDAELVEALEEITEGNPFFLSETIELLAESGALDADSALREHELPDGVRDVVGRRLDRLSKECNRLLRRASVIGIDLSLGVLERFGGLPTERLLERLDEAVASGLVQRVGAGAGRYRFGHALVRQALYEELSTAERIRLHRELAEQLADLYSGNPEPFLDALAHHFYQAAPGGDVDRAVEYSERAARAALEILAYEQGTAHYERALEALELRAERDELRRCQLLLELGHTFELTGERERMRETYALAAQAARALGRPDLLARAALGFAGRTERGVSDARSRAILDEALEALGEDHDALRARVLSYLLGTPPYRDSIETRAELSAHAVELARHSGDPDALLEALAARGWVLLGPDHVEERLRVADEAFAIVEQSGGGLRRFFPIETRIRSFLALGDLASADREIVRYRELTRRLRWPAFQFLGESYGAGRALADGRFDDAETHCRRQFEFGSASQHPATDGFLLWYRFWLQRERGEPVLQDLAERIDLASIADFMSPSLEACLTALGAFNDAEQGNQDATRRALDRLPAKALRELPRDEHWITTMALLADATAQLRDSEHAGLLYDLLLPYAEQNLAHDLLRSYLGSCHHYLARLAGSLDRFDQAEIHYEAALHFNEHLNAPPLIARTQAAWGELLWTRDRTKDRRRARELLEPAHTTAVELGMPDLARRTRGAGFS